MRDIVISPFSMHAGDFKLLMVFSAFAGAAPIFAGAAGAAPAHVAEDPIHAVLKTYGVALLAASMTFINVEGLDLLALGLHPIERRY